MIRWGLVGLGRAGVARRRALTAREDCQLVYESSRRDTDTLSFEELLESDVDAIAICRESQSHGDDTVAALRARKHVLVEYPFALTAHEAELIVEESRRASRLVHVGHLAMLSPVHLQVMDVIHGSTLRTFTYSFQAGYGRAVRPLSEARMWGQNANSRLHALWSWFGALEFVSSRVQLRDAGYMLEVKLRNAEGIEVILRESRHEGQRRARLFTGSTVENQAISFPDWTAWRGGFSLDTAHFVERLKGSSEASYVSMDALVQVVALSETISDEAQIVHVT